MRTSQNQRALCLPVIACHIEEYYHTGRAAKLTWAHTSTPAGAPGRFLGLRAELGQSLHATVICNKPREHSRGELNKPEMGTCTATVRPKVSEVKIIEELGFQQNWFNFPARVLFLLLCFCHSGDNFIDKLSGINEYKKK